MKSAQSHYQSHQSSTQRGQTYFERNFSLMGGHFVPPIIEVKAQADFPHTLEIRNGSELERINTSHIHSIEAAGDYMCFNCLGGKTHIVRKTMKQLEGELDPKQFIRIHRSNMVNINKIRQVTTDNNGDLVVLLANDQSLKVSRRYKAKVAPLIRAFMYN